MAFRSTSFQTLTSVSTATTTLPAGVQPSDILLLVYEGIGDGSGDTGWSYTSGGAGWSNLAVGGTPIGSNGAMHIAWALGTAAAPVINFGGTISATISITAFSGRSGATPTFTVGTVVNDGNSTTNAPTITAAAGDDIVTFLYAHDTGGGTTAAPTGSPATTLIFNNSVSGWNTGSAAYVANVAAGTTTAYVWSSQAFFERFTITVALKAAGYRASSSTNTTTGATITGTAPTGTVNGDRLYAAISGDLDTGTFTAPTGWTRLASNIMTPTLMDGDNFSLFECLNYASGTTGFTWTFSSSTSKMNIIIVALRGLSNTAPARISVTPAAGMGSGSITYAITGAEAQAGDAMVIFGVTDQATQGQVFTISTPSGTTLATNRTDAACDLFAWYRETMPAGFTGAFPVTLSWVSGSSSSTFFDAHFFTVIVPIATVAVTGPRVVTNYGATSFFDSVHNIQLSPTPTAGNTLLVVAGQNTPANFVSLLTNTGGSGVQDYISADSVRRYFRFSNIPAGLTDLIYTSSASDSLNLEVIEVSGIQNAAPDITSAPTMAGGFGLSHTFTFAPPTSGDFAFGAYVFTNGGADAASFSPYLKMNKTDVNTLYGYVHGVIPPAGSTTYTVVSSGTGDSGPTLELIAYKAAQLGIPMYYITA